MWLWCPEYEVRRTMLHPLCELQIQGGHQQKFVSSVVFGFEVR